MADLKLLPCPVCGEQPKWRGNRSDYARGIYRLQCLGETHLVQSYGPSEEACITAWNTRPATSSITGEAQKRIERAIANPYQGGIWEGRTFNEEPFVTVRLSDMSAILAALPLAPREGWQEEVVRAAQDALDLADEHGGMGWYTALDNLRDALAKVPALSRTGELSRG